MNLASPTAYTVGEAERMVKLSALLVAGIYFYRRFTGPAVSEPAPGPAGPRGPVSPRSRRRERRQAPLGAFLVGWGFTYLSLSAIAGSWPNAAGNFALLILIASLLANGVEVSRDIQAGVKSGAGGNGTAARRGGGGREPAPAGGGAGRIPEPERRLV